MDAYRYPDGEVCERSTHKECDACIEADEEEESKQAEEEEDKEREEYISYMADLWREETPIPHYTQRFFGDECFDDTSENYMTDEDGGPSDIEE